MTPSFKRNGYTIVSPCPIAKGAQQIIGFLKKTFGGSESERFDMPNGAIAHAEVQIGDTAVMIGDAGTNWPPVSADLHVYVENVDDCYQRALEAGGVSVQAPERKGEERNRRAGVKDPSGNTWWTATQVV